MSMQLASRRLLRGLLLTRVVGSYSLSIVYYFASAFPSLLRRPSHALPVSPAGSSFAFQRWLEKQVAGRSRLSVSWQKKRHDLSPVTRVGFMQRDDSRLLKAVLSPEHLRTTTPPVVMFSSVLLTGAALTLSPGRSAGKYP